MHILKHRARRQTFRTLGDFARDRSGLSTMEFTVAAALLAVVVITGASSFGNSTSGSLMRMNSIVGGNDAPVSDRQTPPQGESGENGQSGSAGGDASSGKGGDNSGAPASDNGDKGKKKKKDKKKKKKKGKKKKSKK